MIDRKTCKPPAPRGYFLIEVLVSASILLVVVSVTTSATIRLGRLWTRIEQRSAALAELNIALDTMLSQPDSLALDTPKEWEVEPAIHEFLPEARLRAVRHRDQDGDRVTVQIQWRREFPGAEPLSLVGWIDG